jgi:hypothetical protein
MSDNTIIIPEERYNLHPDYLKKVCSHRLRTIEDTIFPLPKARQGIYPLSAPRYDPDGEHSKVKVAMVVESMARHMTDEGHQIGKGLEESGYVLAGHRCTFDSTDTVDICHSLKPETLLVQDKREWDLRPRDFREKNAAFRNVEYLKSRANIFKLTILKDAQQRPDYHMQSASEMGVHAWVIYYNSVIVSRLAQYTRPQHLIRTYHSVNPDLVPVFLPGSLERNRRKGCLLSGAIHPVYPLRTTLVKRKFLLPDTDILPHPGYHMRGCHTPSYLRTLSHYKVAICTSSMYGYALRKIIEATACGCMVVTDLPVDEVLPEIDGNLIRVPPSITATEMAKLLPRLYQMYDPDTQRAYSEKAKSWYDYRQIGARLSRDIENMRLHYNGNGGTV